MATGVPRKAKAGAGTYELSYPAKLPRDQVLCLHPARPTEHSTGDSAIRLFEGDNLAALLWLRQDRSVRHKVRCVYIDPPFATSMAFLGRDTKHAYSDFSTGAEYLEFMRRRLIVLHDLLADNGALFVHLDQNMVFEIKVILDELFGRSNFRNFITRKKCNTKNYTRKVFGNVSDHILFYSKSDKYVWHRPYDPWSDERVREEYAYVDAASGRRYKKVPIHAPGIRNGQTGKPWRGVMPPPGKHWQYPPSKLEELDRAGEIYWSPTGNPRRKVFLDPAKGIPAQDMWLQYKDPHNQNIPITGYPTEKNLDLVSRLLAATTNPGDLVLDAFCGSGTTLEAARLIGRTAIGIDNSEVAIHATLKRLREGRAPMGDFVQQRARRRGNPQASLFE